MRKPFRFKTIIDRIITNENHDIIFGEKPGNVYDAINDENQLNMIKQLETQIDNQQKVINKLKEGVQNQETQIDNQQTQINNQQEQIDNQELVIMALQGLIDESEQQTENQELQLANQDEMIARLEETFDVVVNGNIMELYGSSSDDKPTDVKIGTTFFEHDTTDVYMFTGSTWVAI